MLERPEAPVNPYGKIQGPRNISAEVTDARLRWKLRADSRQPLQLHWGFLISGLACSMLPFTSSVFTSDFWLASRFTSVSKGR
jgi:hypothetical protein